MRIVIKIGGSALEDESTLLKCARAVVEMAKDGHRLAVVHGGGTVLTRTLKLLGKQSDFINGLRITDEPTLNVVDEAMLARVGAAPFVLVVEEFNRRTGLGSRFGTWLLERGFTPKYAHLGTHQEGCGGLWEQFPQQGLDPTSIINKVKALMG